MAAKGHGGRGGGAPSPAAAAGAGAGAPSPGAGAAPPRYGFRSTKARAALTAALFAEYNAAVFRSALPPTLPVEWDPRLRTTAGMTYQRTGPAPVSGGGGGDRPRLARITLSIKVVDTPFRLAQTLLHEMCHAAQWLVDGVSKPPHGAAFAAWARRATAAYPGRAVTVCHSYEIAYKYTYACVGCGALIKRHSKSISDADRCGRPGCGGKLALVVGAGDGGSGAATPTAAGARTPGRTPSEYQ